MAGCSDYISRAVKMGYNWDGSLLSANSCTLSWNYLKSFNVSIRENIDKAGVISGSRDQARIAVLGEETEVEFEHELMSPYPLYFALGSISPSPTPPFSISVGSTLPTMTFARYLEPVETGEQKLLRVWGAKVDSMEFNVEANGLANISATCYGNRATIDTSGTITASIDYTKDPVYFNDFTIKVDTQSIDEISRISFTVNNNLERKYAISTSAGYGAYCIPEGFLEIEGRLELGGKALGMLEKVLNRTAGHTIELIIAKTHGGEVTSTITLPNVMFNEYPEKIEGIEPYSIEIPFQAIPSSSQPAIKIVTNTLIL